MFNMVNIFQKIKNFFINLKKEFNQEFERREKLNEEEFDNKIENINNMMDLINENNDKQLNKINKMKKEIEEDFFNNKNNIKKKEDLYKEFEKKLNQELSKLNPENFTLFYADDHPGALFQMFNDLRVVLEKKSYIVNIKDDLKEKIENFNINFKYFNIISFATQYAAYEIEYFIEKIQPDIAILDIVFGGIIYDNKVIALDGIDLARIILKKYPNTIILFYTGCDITDNSKEHKKLEKLIKEYPDNIFITDKDINDNTRIQALYNTLNKLFEKNSEKYQKLLKRKIHEKCAG